MNAIRTVMYTEPFVVMHIVGAVIPREVQGFPEQEAVVGVYARFG